MTIELIGETLQKIGFEKMESRRGDGPWYRFKQKYPQDSEDNNLYVSFEKCENYTLVRYNCFNICHEDKLDTLASVQEFLDNLDYTVLNGIKSWIYTERHYFDWREPADEQRKRYFDARFKMKYKPCKPIADYIAENGLKGFKSPLDTIYKGKKISDMSWEELAEIVVKVAKKEQKKK
jgi:hypothetical protein